MNTISNLLSGANNIVNMPSYGNLTSSVQSMTKPLYTTPIASTLPLVNSGGIATNGNFFQNFISQMMNFATTFMQNMFALVGLGAQGGNTGLVNGSTGGLNLGDILGITTSPALIGGTQGSSSGGFLNTIGSVLGGLVGSNGTSDSGFSFSNIWSSIKNIFGGLFGGSSNGTSDSGSGSFFSNLWSGVKNIFGGLFGGSSSSSSDSGIGSFLGTACSFVKDLFC